MKKNVSLAVINSGDISGLSKSEQKEILAIKNDMDLSYQNTLNFASEASANLRDFSTSILQSIKVKDLPEVDSLLGELMSSIDEIDPNTLLVQKPSLFQKLFKTNDIKKFLVKYDDISAAMVDVKGKLHSAKIKLEKDVAMCDNYLEQNKQYINDLDKFILAGTIKLQEVAAELKERDANLDPSDTLEVQEINRLQGGYERLDRKIYNLKLLREIAIQNIPQINLIQQGDCVLIEKIQSSIDSAIPLWESQIVISIALAKQKNGLEIEQAITTAINNMIKNNSELIKSSSIEIAKQLEAGIIDIDVLQKSSQNLIETLEGVKRVRLEGKQKREEATKKLLENQKNLNQAMLMAPEA